MQEAFLRAHRALRDDARPVELKPWLHRIVRNLCIDELRRNRLPTTELSDGDRAGAGEDVYSTLSRRHELRRLIEDLADLPEQQRAALLMRELDGLSHDAVANALEISPAASRQLVKRARTGLVAAAEARDADCAAIRDVLLDRPRRAPPALRARPAAPQDLRRLPRVPRQPQGHPLAAARARPADRHGPAGRGPAPGRRGRGRDLQARGHRGLLRGARGRRRRGRLAGGRAPRRSADLRRAPRAAAGRSSASRSAPAPSCRPTSAIANVTVELQPTSARSSAR